MALLDKTEQVSSLHRSLDRRTQEFAKLVDLSCPTGCGVCCANPAIDASILDVLPLASGLIAQGRAEATLDELALGNFSHCYFLESTGPGQGRCTQYALRPSLCRLFGYCGRISKQEAKVAVGCSVLKASLDTKLATHLEALATMPTFNEAREELENIDPVLARMQSLPAALTGALEKLLLEKRFAHV